MDSTHRHHRRARGRQPTRWCRGRSRRCCSPPGCCCCSAAGGRCGVPHQGVLKDTTLRFGTPSRPQQAGREHGDERGVAARAPQRQRRPSAMPPRCHRDRRPSCSAATSCSTGWERAAWPTCSPRSPRAWRDSARVFVLKRLRPELAKDKEAISAVHRRGAHAGQPGALEHRAGVRLRQVGDEYFMTQEYIVGRDLVPLIARYYDTTPGRSARGCAYYVAHETLLALAVRAHQARPRRQPARHRPPRRLAGQHHRVGPGRGEAVGLRHRQVEPPFTQTQVGMVKGNASFMSPEQARGQDVDARSDLFSLALVLYYCLTGRLLTKATTIWMSCTRRRPARPRTGTPSARCRSRDPRSSRARWPSIPGNGSRARPNSPMRWRPTSMASRPKPPSHAAAVRRRATQGGGVTAR